MEDKSDSFIGMLCGTSVGYMRRLLFRVLSAGPVPEHIAFILDGNRRYARKLDLGEGMGHRAGFLSLMSLMKYSYELGIKYMTIYAFSIDNFRRKPHEVKYVMDLMLEKIEGLLKEENIVKQYGVRVYFIGNLKLLDEPVRRAAETAMKVTENNSNCILLICVAYTSTDEIVHSAQECCEELWGEIQGQKGNHRLVSEINDEKHGKLRNGEIQEKKGEENEEYMIKKKQESKDKEQNRTGNGENNEKSSDQMSKEIQLPHQAIKLSNIEKHLYMGVAPDVDILVRTSGETRLSNFLLWQTGNGLLYSPKALWPEIGLPHLVWAVLNFQRAHGFFKKRKKQL